MVGTAPSTRGLAPFDTPDWEIWGQADYWADLKRIDRWFELAPMAKLKAEFRDYLKFLSAAKFPVWMRAVYPEVPTSQAFPFEDTARAYGREFMSATVVWMMGQAITEHIAGRTVGTIGLWGYDMALDGEYSHQRPGIRHMEWICRYHVPALGFPPIKVLVPLGSDLSLTPIPYPFADEDPLVAKARARKRDLAARKAQVTRHISEVEAVLAKARGQLQYLNGADEDANYWERNFCGVKTPAA